MPFRHSLAAALVAALPIALAQAQLVKPAGPSPDKGQSVDNAFKHGDRTLSNDTMVSDPAKPAVLAAADQAFFRKAAVGGLAEVEAGKLAAQRGRAESIKAFGETMVADHSSVNTELQTLADTKGVTLPSSLDASHQAAIDALAKKKGASFDTAFVAAMKKDHAEAITLFKTASKSKDPDIAAFATSKLPALQHHQASIPKLTSRKKTPSK